MLCFFHAFQHHDGGLELVVYFKTAHKVGARVVHILHAKTRQAAVIQKIVVFFDVAGGNDIVYKRKVFGQQFTRVSKSTDAHLDMRAAMLSSISSSSSGKQSSIRSLSRMT